jgi:acetaldehyde dehydrogenase / alcohol dehydrogenase
MTKHLQSIMAMAKSAQRVYATYNQHQVDRVFRACAMAAFHASQELADAAVQETRMGNAKDKYLKNVFASKVILDYFADLKTVGVIEDSSSTSGIRKTAHPMGIVAAITPTTNPTSTAIYNALLALKTRNAIVVAPHPRAHQCTKHALDIVAQAAYEAGAPEGLVSCLPEAATVASTQELIGHEDV